MAEVNLLNHILAETFFEPVDLLTASSRAHCSRVPFVILFVINLDLRRRGRDDDGST